jgi:hypothetical protein
MSFPGVSKVRIVLLRFWRVGKTKFLYDEASSILMTTVVTIAYNCQIMYYFISNIKFYKQFWNATNIWTYTSRQNWKHFNFITDYPETIRIHDLYKFSKLKWNESRKKP